MCTARGRMCTARVRMCTARGAHVHCKGAHVHCKGAHVHCKGVHVPIQCACKSPFPHLCCEIHVCDHGRRLSGDLGAHCAAADEVQRLPAQLHRVCFLVLHKAQHGEHEAPRGGRGGSEAQGRVRGGRWMFDDGWGGTAAAAAGDKPLCAPPWKSPVRVKRGCSLRHDMQWSHTRFPRSKTRSLSDPPYQAAYP
eukprot:353169-Chlamydomonas_euryale.AAC.3